MGSAMKKCQNIELTGKKRLENQNGHGRWSRDLRKAEMAKDKNEWRCHMNAEQEHLCRRVVYKMQGWLFAMANKIFAWTVENLQKLARSTSYLSS